jgi:C4-dicarboxylate-specific signal transduction histidine kinase
VRWSLDYYAMREAARVVQEVESLPRTEGGPEEQLDNVVRSLKDAVPSPVYQQLREAVVSVKREEEKATDLLRAQSAILGTLATAGMTAAAYEHEIGRQLRSLDDIVTRLEGFASLDPSIAEVASDLKQWARRARSIRNLFGHLLDADPAATRRPMKATKVVSDSLRQLGVLLRSVPVDLSGVSPELDLPPARYSEWLSVLQNLLTNALTAVIDQPDPRIAISTETDGAHRRLVIEDNGSGVELTQAESLFAPFKRRAVISRERQALGYGGSGLGLTIVRMICESIGCTVGFERPSDRWATRIAVRWEDA